MNMMKPSVTSFSGRENINDFRTMYAMTSTMLKWSEDDKAKNIRAFLSGEAAMCRTRGIWQPLQRIK
jgi:hypothetical protein